MAPSAEGDGEAHGRAEGEARDPMPGVETESELSGDEVAGQRWRIDRAVRALRRTEQDAGALGRLPQQVLASFAPPGGTHSALFMLMIHATEQPEAMQAIHGLLPYMQGLEQQEGQAQAAVDAVVAATQQLAAGMQMISAWLPAELLPLSLAAAS